MRGQNWSQTSVQVYPQRIHFQNKSSPSAILTIKRRDPISTLLFTEKFSSKSPPPEHPSTTNRLTHPHPTLPNNRQTYPTFPNQITAAFVTRPNPKNSHTSLTYTLRNRPSTHSALPHTSPPTPPWPPQTRPP